MKIAVVDYGMGNIRSVSKALEHVAPRDQVLVTSDPSAIRGADRALAELPVVLVTALATREHRERGIEVGANAYLVKGDLDQGNLLEAVRRLA